MIECEVSFESISTWKKNLKYFSNLKELNLDSKYSILNQGNSVNNEFCETLFRSLKYITNLEVLKLTSNKRCLLKLENGINELSSPTILKSAVFFKSLKRLSILSIVFF